MTTDRVVTFGPYRLDAGTESVWRGSEEIRLRPKTFAVLRYLVDRPARLVTKEELLEAIWPEVTVGEAALAVCVGEIRKALGDEARTPLFVETVHRRGYRFVGRARAGAGHAAPAAASAIVGRDEALRRLREWRDRAVRGGRHVGFVTGPPGIGKTALVDEFLATLPAGEFWSARGQCLDQYGAGEPYLPMLEALTRLARSPDGDRIVALLGRHAPTWLAQMPGLVTEDELSRLQARLVATTRARMLREMAEALESLAMERPVVIVIEDLHWSDPSTLDLIAAVARRREPARLLLIGTYRPVDAIARGHSLRTVTQELALHGVSDELPLALLDAGDLARYLGGRFDREIGARLAPILHRRTDGLPLFVVNVVDALVRDGLLIDDGGRWALKAVEADVDRAVPDNLRAMIERQLAALALDEQRLLEAASVSGTTFSAASVAAALDVDVETIEDRCEALSRRHQFIRDSGVEEWPDGTVATRYGFLHVLYQHVLYERIPAARCASLHRRVGDREDAAYRARPGERAGALAVHFERSRDLARAIRYRRQAAENATLRYAYAEAIHHATLGRALVDRLANVDERPSLEVELLMAQGPPLISLHGSGAPEVEAVYLRAREIAEGLGDPARVYPALWGLWFFNYSRGRYRDARDMGERLLAIGDAEHDTGWLLEAHHALWATLIAMGDAAAAIPHIERGQGLYDLERHRTQAFLYGGHDAGTCSWYHLARARWLLGCPDQAVTAIHEASAVAARLDHPMTTMICLQFAAWVFLDRGDRENARRYARDSSALATAHGFSSYVDDSAVLLLCTAEDGTRTAASILGSARRVSSGSPGRAAWRNVLCLAALARAALAAGDVETATDVLQAVPEDQRETFYGPELERLHGELWLRRRETDEAERAFHRAVEIARRRSEQSLELRAAISLARLLGRSRRGDEGRRMLADVYGRFREGFETADLREARSVLAELEPKTTSPRKRPRA